VFSGKKVFVNTRQFSEDRTVWKIVQKRLNRELGTNTIPMVSRSEKRRRDQARLTRSRTKIDTPTSQQHSYRMDDFENYSLYTSTQYLPEGQFAGIELPLQAEVCHTSPVVRCQHCARINGDRQILVQCRSEAAVYAVQSDQKYFIFYDDVNWISPTDLLCPQDPILAEWAAHNEGDLKFWRKHDYKFFVLRNCCDGPSEIYLVETQVFSGWLPKKKKIREVRLWPNGTIKNDSYFQRVFF
jgi:hypothetical protein